MKLSIVLSVQPASFSALAYRGRLKENVEKIRKLGYDGVELAVRDPALLDVPSLETLIKEHDLDVPALGTGQAYGEEGLSFTHPDRAIRERAIDRIKSQVELASRLGALVIIGLIRGKGQGNAKLATSWLEEALEACASGNKEVRLAVEPINRYETDLVNTVESGIRLIEKVKMDNIGLLLDTFHMNIEEPSILQSIETASPFLFHFHVADSNRWYAGAGHIPFGDIIEKLGRSGYKGYISAEIMPYPDPDTAARMNIEHLRKFVDDWRIL